MSVLRHPIQNTKTRGAKTFAIVEEAYQNLVTVRLGTTGARLTNLKTLSPNLAPGDQVIVDFASNDQPYVRAVPKPSSQAINLTTGATPAEENELIEVYAARVTTSGPVEFLAYRYDGINPKSFFPVFTEAIFDTANMHTNGYLVCRSPGRYFVHTTIAITAPSYETGWEAADIGIVQTTIRSGGQRWRRWSNKNNDAPTIVSCNTIVTQYPGDSLLVRIALDWGSSVRKSTVVLLHEPGKYPILEAWKISDIGSGPQAPRSFWVYL
jgi:hypothetical protein